jgi:hypothetical protein
VPRSGLAVLADRSDSELPVGHTSGDCLPQGESTWLARRLDSCACETEHSDIIAQWGLTRYCELETDLTTTTAS